MTAEFFGFLVFYTCCIMGGIGRRRHSLVSDIDGCEYKVTVVNEMIIIALQQLRWLGWHVRKLTRCMRV